MVEDFLMVCAHVQACDLGSGAKDRNRVMGEYRNKLALGSMLVMRGKQNGAG